MSRKHGRPDFYVSGECVYGLDKHGRPGKRKPNPIEETRKFRFSRIGPKGEALSPGLLEKVAAAMVPANEASSDSKIPAGFTYLGQFVDHDLTLDKTATKLGDQVSIDELIQGRSPALDLDSLYGLGPVKDHQFYTDGVHLKVGTTERTNFPDLDPIVSQSLTGFDLPRVGSGQTKAARRRANIPDARNDENLAVAQIHLAFIHLHNNMVDKLMAAGTTVGLFEKARAEVVKHYQRMLRDDLLPRICDASVVNDVFKNGRRLFETLQVAPATKDNYSPLPSGVGTGSMPVEFSVAAYRLGHSMARTSYEWNRVFRSDGPGGPGTLEFLFRFSGTSGTLSPPDGLPETGDDAGSFEALPTNWIANFNNLFELDKGTLNFARKIDTNLSPPMGKLPLGSFGGLDSSGFSLDLQRQLAFRNLLRAGMVELASGQQMIAFAKQRGVTITALTEVEILKGAGQGADLTATLTPDEQKLIAGSTPLFFYILREAELTGGEHLGPLGSRIVAETFHRAIETSTDSIIRDPLWKPTLGNKMADLLRFAHGSTGLNPLG